MPGSDSNNAKKAPTATPAKPSEPGKLEADDIRPTGHSMKPFTYTHQFDQINDLLAAHARHDAAREDAPPAGANTAAPSHTGVPPQQEFEAWMRQQLRKSFSFSV